jgi:23S rRNA (uracil1939-C5)-methyltransferase
MDLLAERMVAGGIALARAGDGRVVLVEGALPGERVRVEIDADRADHIRAHVVEVLDAAAARITPPCPYVAAGCGGCGWQHVDVDAQRAYKRDILADALVRIAHIDDPPFDDTIALSPTGYRTTVRALVVDGRAAFRRVHSHDPVVVDTCLVAHPLVDDVLRNGNFGDAHEVVVRAGANTGERCVHADNGVKVDVPSDVRRDHFHEVIEGARLRVSARAFFQTRADGAEALARTVRAAVGRDQRVADLYCGVGLFAATVDTPRRILAVERDRHAVADARHNLRGRPAKIVRSDVGKLRTNAPVDVVVADPSRAGLARDGVRTVLACDPERVVLVSCDAAALARDVSLLADGGFRIVSVTPVDLFPHTPHIECVTVLDR